MSNVPATVSLNYSQLVRAIKKTIADGQAAIRKAKAETYWKIGKDISDYVLHGADRARYGEHIYENLSKELDIDEDTLARAVKFSRDFPISATWRKLPWSKFRAILTLPDPSTREHFIKQTEKHKWTTRQLQKAVTAHKKILFIPSDGAVPKLKVTRGALYTYCVIKPATINAANELKFIDCGFDVFRSFAPAQLSHFNAGDIVQTVSVKTESPAEQSKSPAEYKIKSSTRTLKDCYVFKANIERIVDGDTVMAVIDLGFKTLKRQYLRLRGINCPELSTREGQSVKRFVEARIRPNDFVVIKTHKDDKYGRYLVDVWYAPPSTEQSTAWDKYKVADEGVYLNQELLDHRLAVTMKG